MARQVGGSELEQEARKLYVTRGLLKKFGHTQGFRGCNALQYGTKQEVHSHDCRKRIVQRLQETEAGRGKVEEIEKKQKEREDRRKERETARAGQLPSYNGSSAGWIGMHQNPQPPQRVTTSLTSVDPATERV